jgi:hypothetical protein
VLRILLITLLIFPSALAAQHRWDIDILADTFGVDNSTPSDYPWDEVIQACPRRDCIPSIDKPAFVSATQATFLKDDDVVIAVAMEGEARAYPIRILVRHELVNDRIGKKPILVSYCPLCGSGLVFDRALNGEGHIRKLWCYPELQACHPSSTTAGPTGTTPAVID